ncbi:LOW QUALITY PROTEIN: phospholipase ABHD3-like [Babylonia areolata]|uniref:LOW QUALITY PROTEIN: phospholipase ABHD3-like n=1 Tax=Babylonia areolata TaxID=304850 RepID=UPI003FCF9777
MELYDKVFDFLQYYPSLPLAMAFGGLYAAYYICSVVKKPRIACRDKRLQKLIERHCPIARESYWPTWWCFQSHVMTLLRAIIQSRPQIQYRSEFLLMPDGGQVKLDWVDNDGSPHPRATRPTVLLLPGLTGSSEETYILHMVQEATQLGYRCVVFNNRGNGGADLLTPRTYCASNTEDMECVVNHIKAQLPDAPVMGVGVSLGGMILFNYLAATGKEARLCAAMCVSVAWNVFESCMSLEKPLNLLFFNRYLARLLVKMFRDNIHIFEQHLDVDHVLESNTIREFDSRCTTKLFGYETCDDYYKEASLHEKVHALHVPVLTLNAADDPFSPLHAIPVEDALQNDHIAMVITSHGGHIGFLEGAVPRGKNYMYRWYTQFVDAVFKHGVKDE